MKAETLIQLCGRAVDAVVFQGRLKVQFLVFSDFGLVCCLLWNGFGVMVSMMERDHGCSMDTLYEQCESWFWERIGVKLSGEQRKVEKKKLYEAS